MIWVDSPDSWSTIKTKSKNLFLWAWETFRCQLSLLEASKFPPDLAAMPDSIVANQPRHSTDRIPSPHFCVSRPAGGVLALSGEGLKKQCPVVNNFRKWTFERKYHWTGLNYQCFWPLISLRPYIVQLCMALTQVVVVQLPHRVPAEVRAPEPSLVVGWTSCVRRRRRWRRRWRRGRRQGRWATLSRFWSFAFGNLLLTVRGNTDMATVGFIATTEPKVLKWFRATSEPIVYLFYQALHNVANCCGFRQ